MSNPNKFWHIIIIFLHYISTSICAHTRTTYLLMERFLQILQVIRTQLVNNLRNLAISWSDECHQQPKCIFNEKISSKLPEAEKKKIEDALSRTSSGWMATS
ncbi:Uncharacterized protein Fot_28854 [Forsythia ovata]|uniref:Uncharacterized protein n=1 Tax=Forsythia ovata TaxID=205694 RepID=A0ABD1TQM0_9LAMI